MLTGRRGKRVRALLQQFSYNLRCDLQGTGVRVADNCSAYGRNGVRARADRGRLGSLRQHPSWHNAVDARGIAEQIYFVANLWDHINIDRLEVMPIRRTWSTFAIDCHKA